MAQHFSQLLPEPGRNVFPELCRKDIPALCFARPSVVVDVGAPHRSFICWLGAIVVVGAAQSHPIRIYCYTDTRLLYNVLDLD